jgi:hypothetical protein
VENAIGDGCNLYCQGGICGHVIVKSRSRKSKRLGERTKVVGVKCLRREIKKE